MFPNAFLCFQYPIFVSNIQCMFPIYNFCFQMQMMFPNDNVSNVCFQYTWSQILRNLDVIQKILITEKNDFHKENCLACKPRI